MIASQFQERSVIYRFIRLHQQIYPIEKMCKVMGVGSRYYYAWKNDSNALKTGDLEELLRDTLSRNQINYLKKKLLEDRGLKVEGKIKGARYSIADKYADLRGDILLRAIIEELRSRYV